MSGVGEMNLRSRILPVAVAAAIAGYYLWAVQAAGNTFVWNRDLGGYYNLAARGFGQGHLYFPVSPPAELLALANPWDSTVNTRYRLHDAVLFNRRYYLFHLPGPAIALFLPWRLVTGHDLPENFALFLFSFGGFAFSAAALLRLLRLAGVRPRPFALAVMLLALGLCQGVPYLLSTVRMYEVAIGAGYFFVSAALYCLVRAADSPGIAWCAASGLMFGCAMTSRPHLALLALAGLAAVAFGAKRPLARATVFAIPAAVAGILLLWYNYARFGNPFEFGERYLLGAIPDSRILTNGHNLLPGLYYFLFCAPDFSAVFPWARLILRFPFDSPAFPLPPRYFLEPTAGALWCAPFAIGAAALPWIRRVPPAVKVLLRTVLAATAAVLLFLAATGFTTQRYEVDFLPLLVWIALAALAILGLPAGAMAVPVAFGIVVSLALGISGPRDEMLKNRPEDYLRIASFFSPVAKFRPVLNPPLSAAFTAEFAAQPEHYREPLLTAGRQADFYYLYAEHLQGKIRIASYRELSEVDCLIEPGRPVAFDLKYDPLSRTMHVSIDGQERLTHNIGNLVTAPADVTVGENRIDPNITEPRFTGRLKR